MLRGDRGTHRRVEAPRAATRRATFRGWDEGSESDAREDEGAGAFLAFAVTLSRVATGTVRVDYATANGSARSGVDYTGASGTLTFETGESSKTARWRCSTTSTTTDEETLTRSLWNAWGGRVTENEARARSVNSDPLPRALLDAVRADGGGARGRARRGADGGAARAGASPAATAEHGAQHRAELPEPAPGLGRRERAGRRPWQLKSVPVVPAGIDDPARWERTSSGW